MNKTLIVIVVAVVAVAAVAAAVVLMNNGGDKSGEGGDTDGAQLSCVKNLADYEVSVYLGQKGSADMVLLDNGGTFDIPSKDPIIILKAKDTVANIYVQENHVMIPRASETLTATVGFQYADNEDPVIMDSVTAYYAFTPKADLVNLGLFITND